jgi:cytochrome b561
VTRRAYWDPVVIVLHWLSAIAIISLLALGLYMTRADFDAARKFDLYQLHKALGWLTLVLTVARLVVRALTRAPEPLATISPMTNRLARAAHLALYGLALTVGLSGWVRISSAIIPIPIDLFGFANVPDIAPMNLELSDAMATTHRLAACALAALVALHAAAALKHHFVDRDATMRRIMSARGEGHGAHRLGTRGRR